MGNMGMGTSNLKINYRYLILIFNAMIGACAFVLGTRMPTRLLKPPIDSRSSSRLMIAAASDAISARAFAFDYDIAMGTLDPVKPKVLKESIEQNLQSLLLQYEVLPKQRYFFRLERHSNIKGATPEQNKIYQKLLIEREVAISREQKLAITQKIREVLGNLREESAVSVVGSRRKFDVRQLK